VEQSGVNDVAKLTEIHHGTTFRDQAMKFMAHSITRNKKPVKPATAAFWQNCLDTRLLPILGDMKIFAIDSKTLQLLVAELYKKQGQTAKSVNTYVALAKQVITSATDERGNLIIRAPWNHKHIDLPPIEDQRAPDFSAETISSIVEHAEGPHKVFFALLATTGMRAGELLGLELQHVSSDCKTIYVRQSSWQGQLQSPKSKAVRDIELCDEMAEVLRAYVATRNRGLLFSTRSGRPISQSNLLRRVLHPILKQVGIEPAGYHAFRRFRATLLRESSGLEEIIKFWLGHSGGSDVTDRYSKLAERVALRVKKAGDRPWIYNGTYGT